MSIAPRRPDRSFFMTSGAMYIGVPARLFIAGTPSTPPAPTRPPVACWTARLLANVLLPLMITLAAPKSTNLMVELEPSRMSGKVVEVSAGIPFRLKRRHHSLSGFTSRCSTPFECRYSRPCSICRAYTRMTSSSSIRPCSSRFARLPPSQYSSKM
jgi:hypothetical protein